MKQKLRVFLTLLLCAVASVGWGQTTYKLEQVTSVEAGGLYVFEQDGYVMNNTVSSSALQTTNSYSTTGLTGSETYVWTLEENGDGFNLRNVSLEKNYYLYYGTSGTGVSLSGNERAWVFTFDSEGYALIQVGSITGRFLGYTSSDSHAYKAYATSNLSSYSHAIVVYKLVEEPISITTVATPTFNPIGGLYTSAQNVTISTTTADANIYYTIDGTQPTNESTPYTEAIPVNVTTTINAIAVKEGMDDSNVASATYTILEHAGTEADPYSVADARAAIDANAGLEGVYATGIVTEIVTPYNSQYGNISYNISTDGTATSDQLQAYRGKSYNGANFTSEDDIQVGDVVVVYGTLKNYNGTYEFDANNQLVSLQRAADVEAPVFSPEGGAYKGTQSVTITATTEGATIYYTTDGSTPTVESTEYTGAISVSTSTTLKAIAVKGAKSSAVVTARYAILEHAGTEADPYTVADARAAIDVNAGVSDVYAAGIIAKVDNFADGAITYWISADGTADGDMLEAYKGKNLEDQAFNEKDDLQVGDIVTIRGDLTKYNTTYEFAAGNYLVSFERPVPPVETPKVHVGNLTNVTIANMWIGNDDLTDITDGSEVEEGTEVFVTLTISEGCTFESISVVDANNNQVEVTENSGSWSFFMPASSVTINATATAPAIEGDKYVKVTSTADITDGEYLIVYEDGKVAFNGGLETLDAVGNTIAVTISDNEIAATAETNAAVFTIDVTAGTLKSASGKYIGVSSNSNGLKDTEVADTYTNSFSIDDDGNAVISAVFDGSTMTLRYNKASNQNRFRYFKSGQEAIQLYKKVGETPQPETVTVTISKAGSDKEGKCYGTLYYSDKNLVVPEGVEAYTYTVNDGKLSESWMYEAGDVIPAATGVVLKTTAAITENATYEFEVTTTEGEVDTDNMLLGTDDTATTTAPEGSTGEYKFYALSLNSSNAAGSVGFYYRKGCSNGEDFTNGAHKAYLAVPVAQAAGVKGFSFSEDTDGIRQIENGQSAIDNAAIYNLNGQRVNKAQKGIYIVNGKKVVVK